MQSGRAAETEAGVRAAGVPAAGVLALRSPCAPSRQRPQPAAPGAGVMAQGTAALRPKGRVGRAESRTV